MDFNEFVQSCIDNQKYGDISNAAFQLQKERAIGFEAYWNVFVQMGKEKADIIQLIHNATNDQNPLKGVSFYFLSGLNAHSGDIQACKANLKNALIYMQSNLNLLAKSDGAVHSIQSVMKQFALITPEFDLNDQNLSQIKFDQSDLRNNDAPAIVFASGNGTYFDKFGEAFIQSVREDVICHIHVINPETDFDKRIVSLRNKFQNLNISTEIGPQEATFYACRRFQILHHVMDLYQKDIIVSDIDTALTQNIMDLAGLNAPCGLFKENRFDPMLIMHLSLSYYASKPETISFLKDLDRYLQKHMSQGYVWTLDQCAFLCVALMHQNQNTDFEIVDFAGHKGQKLENFQRNQDVSLDQKYEMRQINQH